MHAAAAKACHLARRIETGTGSPAASSTRPERSVLQATQGLAGQDIEPNADQRPCAGSSRRCGLAVRINFRPDNRERRGSPSPGDILEKPLVISRSRASI